MAAVAVGGIAAGGELFAPTWVVFPLMLLAAALVGALLLLGPAVLKLRFGVDEVVTTLLMNFIVLLGVSARLDGPMKDTAAMGWPQSMALASDLELWRPIQGLRLHAASSSSITRARE